MADEYLTIDLGKLRIREIEEIEEIAEAPFDSLFQEGKPRGKALRAIGYVVKRRENPDFTLDDAGELIVNFSDDEPKRTDPTPAGD